MILVAQISSLNRNIKDKSDLNLRIGLTRKTTVTYLDLRLTVWNLTTLTQANIDKTQEGVMNLWTFTTMLEELGLTTSSKIAGNRNPLRSLYVVYVLMRRITILINKTPNTFLKTKSINHLHLSTRNIVTEATKAILVICLVNLLLVVPDLRFLIRTISHKWSSLTIKIRVGNN